MKTLRTLQFLAALGCLVVVQAQVPQLINFQGRVAVEGVNFTGDGHFKFALVNGDASAAFWSNDAASITGSEPVNAVTVPVQHGLYSVLLGDATLTNMLPIPSTVFTNDDVRLRVWFSDGTNGFQLLAPDQRIAAVGYAMMAANVVDGSITASKLAPNAVTASSIAAGSIGTAQLAPNAAAENLRAGGQSGVASGGIILSEQPDSTNLAQAGYVRIGQVSLDTQEWQRRPRNALPPTRTGHTTVWTGTEMIIWGGVVRRPGSMQVIENTGVRFNPQTGQWREVSTNNAPAARADHTTVWTGREMIVWGGAQASGAGGRYDPVSDTWRRIAETGSPTARAGHTAVWTGREMLVWGGYVGSSAQPLNDGARFDPATDRWSPINNLGAPRPRSQHTAVWTGTEMIVWGGYASEDLADGGRYLPEHDSWITMSVVGGPSARVGHTAIWTGTEMIVLAGAASDGPMAATYGRYRPSTDSWTTAANPPEFGERQHHTTVWTGSSGVSWGGVGSSGLALNSGATFTPLTEFWQSTPTSGAPAPSSNPTAVWTGTEMITFGGINPSFGRFSPGALRWTTGTNDVPMIAGRRGHTAVWTGSEWLVWGGAGVSTVLNTGFHYNPATDMLTEMPVAGAPSPRAQHTAVWTAREMIVWGGSSSEDLRYGMRLNTGGRYDPITKRWTALLVSPGTPVARSGHTAVWTGTEMIVWGGRDSRGVLDSGARFLPAYGSPVSNVWIAMPTSGGPDARAGHTAVWTGDEMIVWGGYFYGTPPVSPTNLNTGGHYSPAENDWMRTTTVRGAPSARNGHRAIWTGTEMLIWGGTTNQSSRTPPGSGLLNLATGARYNPITETWIPMSTNNLPAFLAFTVLGNAGLPNAVPTAVWTGSELLVWGFLSPSPTNLGAGASYRPALDTWSMLSALGDPGSRSGHAAVWTGDGMLLFGGFTPNSPPSSHDPTIYYYVRSKPMYLYQRP